MTTYPIIGLIFGFLSIPAIAADAWDISCMVTNCQEINPAKVNGGCGFLKRWRFKLNYTVNTEMEGTAIAGTDSEWFESDNLNVQGVDEGDGLQLEPKIKSASYPVYAFIPLTKQIANADTGAYTSKVSPLKDGAVMNRTANFGLTFNKYTLLCTDTKN